MTDENQYAADAQECNADATNAQQTLAGGAADVMLTKPNNPNVSVPETENPNSRRRPRTLVWCPECDEWFIRRKRRGHDHVLIDAETEYQAHQILYRANEDGLSYGAGDLLAVGKRSENPTATIVHDPDSALDGDDDPADDEPRVIGAYYDVTVSYSVDYRFRVAAGTDHDAKKRAKELALDSNPTDSHLVHTRVEERATIREGDGGEEDLEEWP